MADSSDSSTAAPKTPQTVPSSMLIPPPPGTVGPQPKDPGALFACEAVFSEWMGKNMVIPVSRVPGFAFNCTFVKYHSINRENPARSVDVGETDEFWQLEYFGIYVS